MNERTEKVYKTLVEAIHERYNEILDESALTPSSPESSSSSSMASSFDSKKDENSLCSFYIPTHSPRKTRKY
jgi:hypothetical protein